MLVVGLVNSLTDNLADCYVQIPLNEHSFFSFRDIMAIY